jgi:hypothetical protein
MTKNFLNDCVLFLNNYYDCFVFEQLTFLICYIDFISHEETKNCIFNFRICCFSTTHIFEQLLFLNNGDFSQIFFTGKETKRFFLDNRMNIEHSKKYSLDDHKNFE